MAETHKQAVTEEMPDRRKNNVAAKMAAEAGVSQRTMERVLGKTKANSGNTHRVADRNHGETCSARSKPGTP